MGLGELAAEVGAELGGAARGSSCEQPASDNDTMSNPAAAEDLVRT